jgi:hypothetical protein
MAIVERVISNLGDPLVAQDGTPLSGIEVIFLLVNSDNLPTDAWDVFTKERIAPIKTTAITDENGVFEVGATDGVSLWPNDRGETGNPTFYRCTVKSRDVRQFCAALPSGDLSTLQWADFYANGTPLSSDLYETSLEVTSGDTMPVTGVIVDVNGDAVDITGYSIFVEAVDTDNVQTDIPTTIHSPLTGGYQFLTDSLVKGIYSARLEIHDSSAQVVHTKKFKIEVTA